MTSQPPDTMELIRRRASENGDDSYGDFVSKVPFEYYRRRVRGLGFVDLGRVLDVGCGFGHWTAALAEVNSQAVGIDQSAPRLAIAEEVARSMSLDNVVLDLGDAGLLPYPDESFDGLFCYGVFMFLDRDRALAEFRRVLRPGGRLYVNTSARGWWLRLWVQSVRGNQSFAKAAFNGWARGGRGTPPHAVGTRRARRLLRMGWEDVEATLEGELGVSASEPTEPVYEGRWHGIESVIEFVAVKSRDDGPANRLRHDPAAAAEVLAAARRTRERQTYEYTTGLARHPQPRPALDLVNNCDPVVIGRAVARARTVDRLDILRTLYRELTEGLAGDEANILACVTFAQKHFFHHFAGQPMEDGVPVHDPVASLLLEYGRCGTSARFLVDLFECNGVPARLTTGACHTWAEARAGERWVIADANLFPPGVLPLNDAGELLSLEEAAHRPDLLNRAPSYVNYHHEFIEAYLADYPETEEEIGHWLRRPLLPSTGYFGADFFVGEGRTVGAVRHLKNGDPKAWADDPLFGWGSLVGETVPGPGLPLEQRPAQVTGLAVRDGRMTWAPGTGGSGEHVVYRVVSSAESRGWEYDELLVGCRFELSGESVHVDEPWIELEQVAGRFVSVVAEHPSWADREIFYLPSRELRVP